LRQESPQSPQVEIQWRFLNYVTAKWYNEFQKMQDDGELAENDHPNFSVDLWLLHTVYLEPIIENCKEHYGAWNHRYRKHTSRSPFHLKGTPNNIYRNHMSMKEPLSRRRANQALRNLADEPNISPSNPLPYEESPFAGTIFEDRFNALIADVLGSSGLSLREKYRYLRAQAYEGLSRLDDDDSDDEDDDDDDDDSAASGENCG